MAGGFAAIPDAPAYRLVNARAPLCLTGAGGLGADAEGLCGIDLTIAAGRIASILPVGTPSFDEALPTLDLDRGLVLPRLVDIHTHLDKGQIWPRRPNPDGTFAGALEAARADRESAWSEADLRARMDFSLRAALAHGTGALRTHLDSMGPQTAISWPLFAELRDEWAGRIALQAVSLFPLDLVLADPVQFETIVATTARHGGVLGGVTFLGAAPDSATDAALDRLFAAAGRHGLDLDLHVDESGAPEATTLERVADAALRSGFEGKILCGHCCSLALMDEDRLARLIDWLAQARIAIVALPMCNLYLQDRRAGRTPRWRGVAPLHELRAAGLDVMVASDNARDPFYAYGDLDPIEVFREAVRILHLDHAGPDWLGAIAATPAALMGLGEHGRIAPGGPADLILLRARSMNEFLARPQSERSVLVAGRAIDTTLPDFRELDGMLRR